MKTNEKTRGRNHKDGNMKVMKMKADGNNDDLMAMYFTPIVKNAENSYEYGNL
jgi:hypothetical protein